MRMDIVDLHATTAPAGAEHRGRFALDVLAGLCARPKRIPAKYFYDDRGSRIFQRITRQSEYYLTAAELEILRRMKDSLPRLVPGERIDIIELGPGDGQKSRLLIEGFLRAGRRVAYYPVDISAQALDMLADNLPRQPGLTVHGVVAEYFAGLRHACADSAGHRLILFLGSNIGNFDNRQNRVFLHRLRRSLDDGDHAVIGFDLKKDVEVLTRAYNDAAGHTRDFNLNLLRRINSELGGDFDPRGFRHFGIYNPVLGAMESYLLSTRDQQVRIAALGRSFRFEAHEPLHLEYSFKFLERDIAGLCAQAGFRQEGNFYDDRRYFVDALWRASATDANGDSCARCADG
jgi:dimethylhistidine N-methyltransferase